MATTVKVVSETLVSLAAIVTTVAVPAAEVATKAIQVARAEVLMEA